MQNSKTKRITGSSKILKGVILYGLLALIAVLCVVPMWHVLMASISDPEDFGMFEGFLLAPVDFTAGLRSYELLFRHKYLWTGYANSIFYTLATVALGLAVCVPAAYALAQKKVLFKRPLLVVILITMFFSGGLIPLYMVVNKLGLLNTRLSMILPACCNALNIVMLRNGILTIPDSIPEAAKIDGAGHLRIMLRIVLPLTIPFIVVVALFNGVANWNSWVNASLFLKAKYQSLYPLQLILRDIFSNEDAGGNIFIGGGESVSTYIFGIRMAAVIVASLPLIVLYPFVQKHFEKGMLIGGVKG